MIYRNLNNQNEKINSNKYNISIDIKDNNKIKNESDLNIKFHQVERREIGIEDNNASKIEENNSRKNSNKKDHVLNANNIIQNFTKEKKKSLNQKKKMKNIIITKKGKKIMNTIYMKMAIILLI